MHPCTGHIWVHPGGPCWHSRPPPGRLRASQDPHPHHLRVEWRNLSNNQTTSPQNFPENFPSIHQPWSHLTSLCFPHFLLLTQRFLLRHKLMCQHIHAWVRAHACVLLCTRVCTSGRFVHVWRARREMDHHLGQGVAKLLSNIPKSTVHVMKGAKHACYMGQRVLIGFYSTPCMPIYWTSF